MTDRYPAARDWFVLVAGWPGSGKSTLAAGLATELGLPLLSKDDYALPLARSLPGRVAEVHCTVPRDLARARYRARSAGRHAGHLDSDRTDTELWGEPVRELDLGPVITVDTSGHVDIPGLAAHLSAILPPVRVLNPL